MEVGIYHKGGDLVAAPREFALKASTELFARFGWESSPEVLREIQQELRR